MVVATASGRRVTTAFQTFEGYTEIAAVPAYFSIKKVIGVRLALMMPSA